MSLIRTGPRHPWRMVLACGLVLPLAAGCGDDAPSNAIPSVDGTMFVDGTFEGLPMFRAATEIQPPTRRAGAVGASYETITARPRTVMVFYEERLDGLGWTVVNPPAETGTDIWTGDWVKDGRRLEVSTSPLPSEDETRTQFDLVLHDDAGATASASTDAIGP